MDCFVTCNKELSSVCAQDCKELINKKAQVYAGVCILRDVSAQDVARLTFYCQSAYRVGILMGECEVENATEEDFKNLKKDITSQLEKNNLIGVSADCSTFGLLTQRSAESEISTTQISTVVGGYVDDFFSANKKTMSVHLKQPELPLYGILTDSVYVFGVDVCGFSLAKRPYKIITQPSALNGVFAYTLAKYVGVTKETVVVDPFSGSATIPIEIALYQEHISCFQFENKFSGNTLSYTKEAFAQITQESKEVAQRKKQRVFGYDHNLKTMQGAKKNAKLAGVHQAVSLSKVDIEWIDSKFDQGEVDIIITNPPKVNKRAKNEKDITKLYDELFYQSRFILNEKGKIGILCISTTILEEQAKRHGFTLEEKQTTYSGEQKYVLLVFSPPKEPSKN